VSTVCNDVQRLNRPEDVHGARGHDPQLHSGEHQAAVGRPTWKIITGRPDVKVETKTQILQLTTFENKLAWKSLSISLFFSRVNLMKHWTALLRIKDIFFSISIIVNKKSKSYEGFYSGLEYCLVLTLLSILFKV